MFLGSAANQKDIVKLQLGAKPKIALVGRSNVGKSSLINALMKTKGMARVSRTPGKTQLFNFFSWKKFILVDLPGYGFAKVPKKLQAHWEKEISEWLVTEKSLMLAVLLVDGRHGFFQQDLQLVEFFLKEDIPFLVTFTKMDKWKTRSKQKSAEMELKKSAAQLGITDFVYTSSEEKDGLAELRFFLNRI